MKRHLEERAQLTPRIRVEARTIEEELEPEEEALGRRVTRVAGLFAQLTRGARARGLAGRDRPAGQLPTLRASVEDEQHLVLVASDEPCVSQVAQAGELALDSVQQAYEPMAFLILREHLYSRSNSRTRELRRNGALSRASSYPPIQAAPNATPAR